MGSDRVRAYRKSSSTLTPGFKPKQFSFLQPRYQDQVDTETDLLTEDKQQNTWSQSNSRPPLLGHNFGQMSVLPIQTKLTIGQPNDKYEQEADRVAEQVMRMSEPKIQRVCPECEEELHRQPMEEEEEEETLQTKPLAEQITPLLQRQTEPLEEEEEEALQTKTTSGKTPTIPVSVQKRITSLQGGGQPLPESERNFFEARFGADFSQVRIHADTQAAETSRAVNARAFTLGRDVVFGAGQYQPRSFEGQRLLAHELTHVVQQNTIQGQQLPHHIRRKWDTKGVNAVLKKDSQGIKSVTDLNNQQYTVIHFDQYKFQRQFYTDDKKTQPDGAPKDYEKNGWHTRKKKEIALSDQRSNDQAASTLVHEVAHANQHKSNEEAEASSKKESLPFPDKLSKELDAHIKQEEFNIAAGIPPKNKSFRDNTGKIKKDAIKKYVERVYAVGSKKRHYTDTKPTYNVIESIKPWPSIS